MSPARHAATIVELEDGRDLAFAEYGDPDGTPVFGFHGTPGSRAQLATADAPARAAGIRVISPDRPGYGASTFSPQRALVDWPQDVAALAGYLGIDEFGVFGVSGGGPHAAVCAHALSERLLGTAIVSGIGPIDSDDALEGMMGMNRLLSRLARSSSALVWGPMALLGWVQRTFPDRGLKLMSRQLPEADRRILEERPDVVETFMRELTRPSRTSARAAAQDFSIFADPWGFRLEDIRMPVHLWQGSADRNVPAAHARLQADRIPDAKLHECAGEGHLLVVEHTREILLAAAGRPEDTD
ncbi:MAG: alpha/beta hydrolase [Deltaproteobacteria bacterium]|nr:alpha/beta hydrolase [Deltaproteobacteria bacterium]